jgi:hypothetical protein
MDKAKVLDKYKQTINTLTTQMKQNKEYMDKTLKEKDNIINQLKEENAQLISEKHQSKSAPAFILLK